MNKSLAYCPNCDCVVQVVIENKTVTCKRCGCQIVWEQSTKLKEIK